MVIRPKSIATVVVRLALHAGQVVGADPGVGQHLLGLQRPDLADRADQRGLAGAEAAGDEDLQRERDAGWPASERTESIDHRLEDVVVGTGRDRRRGSYIEIRPCASRSPSSTRTTPTGRSSRAASSATETGSLAQPDDRRCSGCSVRPARPSRRGRPRRARPDRTRRRRMRPGRRSSRTAAPPARRRRPASRAGRRAVQAASERRPPATARARQVCPDPGTSIAISYATSPMSASASAQHRQAGALAGGGDEEERRLHLDHGLPYRAAAEVPARAPGEALEAGGDRGQVLGVLAGQPGTRPSAARRRTAPPPARRPVPVAPDRRAASRGPRSASSNAALGVPLSPGRGFGGGRRVGGRRRHRRAG